MVALPYIRPLLSVDTNAKPNTPTTTDSLSNQKSAADSAGSGWGDDDDWEDIESKPAQVNLMLMYR